MKNITIKDFSTQVRSIIKEAIADRIKMIDEAGDEAAKGAKIQKIDEEIRIVEAARSHFEAAANILKEYITPQKIKDIIDEIEECLGQLNSTKDALNGVKKSNKKKSTKTPNSPKSEPKSPEKPINESKPSSGLTNKQKSSIVSKARAGKDIGKKGKGFAKVEKAVEKTGKSPEVAKKIAASQMWKGVKRK